MPLTESKKAWLSERIEEYARVYNFAAKLLPGMPEKYYESTNPSELYTKWVTAREDGSQPLKSAFLSALQMFNAIKDACANFKTLKQSPEFKKAKRHPMEMKPNIIKFENSEYDIIRTEPTKGNLHFGIAIGSKKHGKREIFLPLRTDTVEKETHRKAKGKEWGLIDHLELGMRMKHAKKDRDKELARQRKDVISEKRASREKAGIGVITYNLKDNTVSIPKTENTPRFQKKGTLKTFIGVDRGVRNSVVLSAVYVDEKRMLSLSEYQESISIPTLSRHLLRNLTALGGKVVGVKVISSKFVNAKKRQIRKINKKRQYARKEVGHRMEHTTDTISHQISREIVDFVSRFRNPIVFFEDLNMEKKKLRHKHGGKSTKGKRAMLSRWDYGAIKRKTQYKLESIGVWTMDVNPMFTSQTCSHCGAIGIRDGIHFHCERCGLGVGSNPTSTVGQYNADVNASINIALTGLHSLYRYKEEIPLYGYEVGFVTDPYEQPEENIMKPIPTAMIGIEGIKTRKSETVAVYPDNSGVAETNAQASRSTLCGSVQPMVEDHQAGGAPENGFSSWYKEENNLAERTEHEDKTDIEVMLSQTVLRRM